MSEEQLPTGWARTTLEPLGSLYCGQSLTASKVNRDGKGVPYVTGPEQWDGEKVHKDKWTTEPARMAPDGCIFITVKGAGVGKLFPGIACAIGRDVYAYHPSPELPRKFIELSLRFTIAEVVAEAKGDIPGLSKAHILQHSIPLPPLAEQKRIVAKIEELFSELDAGEESLRRARRQLGVYRQSLLKQAFEGKLTAPWRAQHPDLLESPDQLLARIQAERQARYEQQLEEWEAAGGGRGKPKKPTAVKASAIPEGFLDSTAECWMATPLGNLIDEPAYGTSKKCGYETGSIGVLRIPNVVNGAIDSGDLKFADFNQAEREGYALQAGDLLLIRSNGSVSIVGRCALVETKHEDYLYAGYLIRLRPLQRVIAPRFILNQLSSTRLRSQIESAAKSTSGVNNINSKEIQRLTLTLPSLPEQQEIVRLLDEQFEVIEQNEREIDAALKRSEALRQSILKKAFTGQLVSQDPTDEPASTLLTRIQTERKAADQVVKPKKKAARRRAKRVRKPSHEAP